MKAMKVVAYEVHGKTRIFDSVNECCEYYNGIADQKTLQNTQVLRLIRGDGLWEYTENGILHQVFFDEL